MTRRAELLIAVLTIWRWGRQSGDIKQGRPLGGFERWSRWVRDPLVALGCQDPTDRVGETKQRDGRRRDIAELLAAWWNAHRDKPVTAFNLHGDVKLVADPQGRGRQFLASRLEELAGTRLNGFVLLRQKSSGKLSPATYRLERRVMTSIGIIGNNSRIASRPMPPMSPMPLESPASDTELLCKASTKNSLTCC
jgi:hypothetical protein